MKKSLAVSSLVVTFLLGGAIGVNADTYLESVSAYIDRSIKIKIHNQDFALKDTEGNELAVLNYNGSTYLPLRSVAEAAGLPVKWEEQTRTAALGFDSIQLNNHSSISFVDINVNGDWKPSYITDVKKVYSNSYEGVNFEIVQLDNIDFKQAVQDHANTIESYSKIIKIEDIEIKGLKGVFIEYESKDSHSKVAYLESNNSPEYFVVNVFVQKEMYEKSGDVYDQVISTFRKQR